MWRSNSRGLTLLEIAVALTASGVLVGTLGIFFRGFSHTFNMQEQVSERDLNAHYAVKRLSEAIMSAGANLPSKDWKMIEIPKSKGAVWMRISVNPRGGLQYVSTAGFVTELFVDDAKSFAHASKILIDPIEENANTILESIATDYNDNGYVQGVKAQGDGAWLKLAAGVNVKPGDAVYAYAEDVYSLSGTNLMLGDMVLAENIDSLSLSFFTAGKAHTSQWYAMRSARVEVVARTRLKDPDLAKDGGYRKLTLSTDVLLRNRL
ncbi:MAG TPA: hypothetical protein VK465_02130 [Fibrobacteria bacterium]|nr:hypothetical protein [Fibrobacteria bacterium]